MAINKKLIHFKTKSVFNQKLANNEILDTSIVFIQDTREIWTHGQFYDCSGGTTTDTSQWITEEELQELLSPIQSSLVNKLEEEDLEGYAKTEDVPTKLSDLTDDSDFVTNTEATAAYAPKSLVETVDNQATTISTLATKSELSTGLAGKLDNSAASGFVPTTRKINGVALDKDITITATDPNAATKTELNSLSTNLTSEIDKKATSATTLAGYGITDGVNTVDDVQTGTYITDITIEGHTLKTTRGSHTVTGKEVTDALGYTPLQGADITNLASKTEVSNAVTPVSNRVTAIEELIDADSDAVIDKWEEVVTFLDGIGTDNDLEALLAAKANSSTVNALDTRVTNLTTNNIAEGSNLYFTNARAVSALSNTLASYVPTSRTINGKKLTGNITLSASDVSAASTSELNATNTNLANVDAKFANYLPTSGGFMNNMASIKWYANVHSWDDAPDGLIGVSMVNDALGYHGGLSYKGYYGLQIRAYGGDADDISVRGYNHSAWGTWHTLLHSGNVGEYALKLDGSNITPTTIDANNNLNDYRQGYVTYKDAKNPTNNYGNNAVVMALAGAKYNVTFQLAFDGNTTSVGYRNQNYAGTWSTWKTIAFIDSNVASADYATSAGSVAWTDVAGRPTIPSKFSGTSATTSGNSGTNFSAAPGGHTHSVTASGSVSSSFSGTAATSGQNSGTNFSAAPGGHTHSVTAGGSVSSSFTGSAVTSGANSGTNFSAAPGGHTHSVTASGTVTLSGSAANGVLTITASFSGSAVTSGANSGTNTSVSPASHTHSVTAAGSVSSSFTGSAVTSGANSGTNTSVAPAKHTHSVTATGSVSSSFTGSAVTSGANSGTNGSVAPGGHTHTVTATGSIS